MFLIHTHGERLRRLNGVSLVILAIEGQGGFVTAGSGAFGPRFVTSRIANVLEKAVSRSAMNNISA